MKDFLLKVLAGIDVVVFLFSACMLDSDSYVPFVVCAVSVGVLFVLLPDINRWSEE